MKDNDKPTNKERVRLMLLSGKRLTKFFLDRYLQVTNSAELVRQLRKEMTIITVWKVSKNGKRYGEYVYSPPPKICRIKTRAYMDQAYRKI